MRGLSLFSNVGIAETYLDEIGLSIVVANELIKDRARFYRHLYPDTIMIDGDITDPSIFQQVITEAKKKNIDFIMATPPCQGMSVAGSRNPYDERNSLIKYAVDAILAIQPKFILLENVVQQLKTPIDYQGLQITIPEYLEIRLGEFYHINSEKIINTMDYGIAQNRKRAIFLMVRNDFPFSWNFPKKEEHIVTLKEAIGHLPSLYPIIREDPNFYPNNTLEALHYHPWHKPPIHALRHSEAMYHTKTGCTAFDNPYYFPRKEDGTKSKGYNTTYKRMDWDKPAPTVTRYNGVIGSQCNVHPGRLEKNGTYSDPRVLTIYELMIVSSLPDNWNIPKWASETLIRYVIGEGIPPLLIKKIFLELLKEVKQYEKLLGNSE